MHERTTRYRLLVFDWDGTLADSTALIAGAIQQACRDLGLPAPDEASARHVIGLGHRDAISLVAPQLAASDVARFSERYRYHYLIGDADIPLFAGVIDMLDELERGHLLAVATGKSRAGLARALARHGVPHRRPGRPPTPGMLCRRLVFLHRRAVARSGMVSGIA